MSEILFSCDGGKIILPRLAHIDRQDGGHLMVQPSKIVWERKELSVEELTLWSFLVAATGEAMLTQLPQLEGGCINYFDAGNWQLHKNRAPKGDKNVSESRKIHMHLYGRSRNAKHPDWLWGEAPKFPDFDEWEKWASQFKRLNSAECKLIVTEVEALLKDKYKLAF